MHYTIESTLHSEPFGEIIESARRAGTDVGKVQAYSLARQMGRTHPDHTIFITEVESRDQSSIVAVLNPNEDVKKQYPSIEIIGQKKSTKFQKMLQALLKKAKENGEDQQQVFNDLMTDLKNTFETRPL